MGKILPQIDHSEDIDSYKAYNEKREVAFQGCKHSDIKFDKEKHELRCKCGVSYTGERLGELFKVLTSK